MDLVLTPEMIAAITRVAERRGNQPETVLKRAIFSYTGKMDRAVAPAPDPMPSNVVPIRRAEE